VPLPDPGAVVDPVETFDLQAGRYDARAGIPEHESVAIARAVVTESGMRDGDLLVELGAGTGEIGMHLARMPIRHVGLDLSRAMLDVFRTKSAERRPALVVADCDRPWPLPAGCAAAVFASRVIHLLQPEHVARETMRVCRPGGALVAGRIVRDGDGITERLRRRRIELLRERGIPARQGEEGAGRVVNALVGMGGIALSRRIVAEWQGAATPAAVIASWGSMTRMGSVPIDPVTRAEILAEVQAWARAEFDDLDRPQPARSRYAVDIVRLPRHGDA
jgi:SAM-dependent methyltransferase